MLALRGAIIRTQEHSSAKSIYRVRGAIERRNFLIALCFASPLAGLDQHISLRRMVGGGVPRQTGSDAALCSACRLRAGASRGGDGEPERGEDHGQMLAD